jgi:hypothetical protein
MLLCSSCIAMIHLSALNKATNMLKWIGMRDELNCTESNETRHFDSPPSGKRYSCQVVYRDGEYREANQNNKRLSSILKSSSNLCQAGYLILSSNEGEGIQKIVARQMEEKTVCGKFSVKVSEDFSR